MRELRYRRLDPGAFAPYGSYAAMIAPDAGGRAAPRIGAPPVEFFRDLLQLIALIVRTPRCPGRGR